VRGGILESIDRVNGFLHTPCPLPPKSWRIFNPPKRWWTFSIDYLNGVLHPPYPLLYRGYNCP
jgi:hypothetical protein